MIRSLRLRLTLLYAALSALVLAAAFGAGGFFECRSLISADRAQLQAAADAVARHLRQENSLSDAWLARQEAAYSCRFYLEDGGAPLAHVQLSGAAAAMTKAALAAGEALAPGQGELFRFAGGDGRQYDCAALALVSADLRLPGATLYALRDAAVLQGRLVLTALRYTGLWLAGSALLAGAGALLARLALKPTEAALRAQKEFIAAASHELRSPLTVIKSSLQAARDTPERQEKLLAAAEREADRMGRLTDELLFLAGRDARALALAPESLAPDTFLLEVYEAFLAPMAQSGHPLRVTLPESPLPAVTADKERLFQLFSILLRNAAEYAPAGTEVELAVVPSGRGVIFSVRDHGPGVPAAERKRIFERFSRGQHSRAGKEHFGLGLSIASEIAAAHAARLWVEDATGGGAVFRLAFRAPGGPPKPPGAAPR